MIELIAQMAIIITAIVVFGGLAYATHQATKD
jgi:hypothetical protein